MMRPALDPALESMPLRAAPEAEPTHPCVRCGRPIGLDEALCDWCNPLGLPQPAASQAHGTIFLAIVLSVVALAMLGRLAIAGIGPFAGSIVSVTAAAPGLEVSVRVTNDGTRGGSTTCRVFDPTEGGIGPDSAYLLSPQVPAGATVTFEGLVTTLGPTARTLGVDCR